VATNWTQIIPTEKQWSEIERRLITGEPARNLARKFEMSEAAMRKRLVSRRNKQKTLQINWLQRKQSL
jgi:hypothetical protein